MPQTNEIFSTSEPIQQRIHANRIWLAGCCIMSLLAVAWLSYQSYRYFADPKIVNGRTISEGGIDLRNRFRETESWFRGEPVYNMYRDGVYAPASYAIFGILFNRLPWPAVKVLWYLLSFATLAALSWALPHLARAQTTPEKLFLRILPFAMYATGAAIGNGQLIPIVLPLTLYAVITLTRSDLSVKELSLGALCMVLSLVQPTISAPFFWLILVRSPRWTRGAWVVGLYAILTAVAVAFQMYSTRDNAGVANPTGLVKRWVVRAEGGVYQGSLNGGYGTVHDLLASLDLRSWNMWASLAFLTLLGVWIYRHRNVDLWLLLGTTAIIARIWIYHRWYDDLLFLLPLICLFRIFRSQEYSCREQQFARFLFLWLWLFLLPPGILYTIASNLLLGLQITGWLATLLFFGFLSWKYRTQNKLSSESTTS